ncbi:7875_t:CDS:2, partial [Gigaspora margarita]
KGSDLLSDDQTLISKMDFQPAIISEFNKEIENFEETYDDSDTIIDTDDFQEINSDADEWYEMDNNKEKWQAHFDNEFNPITHEVNKGILWACRADLVIVP